MDVGNLTQEAVSELALWGPQVEVREGSGGKGSTSAKAHRHEIAVYFPGSIIAATCAIELFLSALSAHAVTVGLGDLI